MFQICTAVYLFALTCTFACNDHMVSYSTGKYGVDPSIKKAVAKSIKKDGETEMGQMDIQMFENDKEIMNTAGSDKKIPFFIRTSVSGEVIEISALAGMFAVMGYELYIWKDSCMVFFNVTTDEPEIYKLNAADSAYKTGLLVPVRSSKVILTEKPDIKNISPTHPLEGYLEFESNEFYEKSDGGDKKYRVILKAYFRTTEIESHR